MRGKLPKEVDEEAVEDMEDPENSSDELMATPDNDDDEVKETSFFVKISIKMHMGYSLYIVLVAPICTCTPSCSIYTSNSCL